MTSKIYEIEIKWFENEESKTKIYCEYEYIWGILNICINPNVYHIEIREVDNDKGKDEIKTTRFSNVL